MTHLLATVAVGEKFGLVEFRWDIALQILNTLVLFWFLKSKLFGPVTEFMKNREDKIAATIADADQKVSEAEALKAQYEEKLAHIKDEELDILKTARLSAEERTQEMVKGAQREIVDLKNKAQDDIERERISSINMLKDDIADLAMLAASKVVDKELDSTRHMALIDDVISKVGDQTWQN